MKQDHDFFYPHYKLWACFSVPGHFVIIRVPLSMGFLLRLNSHGAGRIINQSTICEFSCSVYTAKWKFRHLAIQKFEHQNQGQILSLYGTSLTDMEWTPWPSYLLQGKGAEGERLGGPWHSPTTFCKIKILTPWSFSLNVLTKSFDTRPRF